MLLTAEENGAGDKSDTPPEVWFKDKDYLKLVPFLLILGGRTNLPRNASIQDEIERSK